MWLWFVLEVCYKIPSTSLVGYQLDGLIPVTDQRNISKLYLGKRKKTLIFTNPQKLTKLHRKF